MYIKFTNQNENLKKEEITKIINEAFEKTDYKVTISECNYDKEKSKEYHAKYNKEHKEEIKNYHKSYNEKKRNERLNEKQQVNENNKTNIETDVKTEVKTDTNIKPKEEVKADGKDTKIIDLKVNESNSKDKVDIKSKVATKDKNTTEQKTNNKVTKKAV